MQTSEQHKLIAITESLVLLSTPKGNQLSIPLADIGSEGATPLKICRASFQLGWAAAKHSENPHSKVA